MTMSITGEREMYRSPKPMGRVRCPPRDAQGRAGLKGDAYSWW
jgi:hypothetical protein